MKNREEFMKERIFTMLNLIETRVGLMAHEIPELKDQLRKWQDGELKTSFFNLTVMNYFDEMNEQGENK